MNAENTEKNAKLFGILKWVLVVLLVAFLAVRLGSNRQSTADFGTVKDTVLASADLSNMQEGDNQMIKRLYGLDPSSFEGICLYYPTTNMGAEEILLVKLSDMDQQETVTAAIESRIESQKNSFDGYGVDQYEMLENSITDVQGNYILLVVASDPEPVDQVFRDAI